ncbi:MAG TPA: GNAT family N-acetyltransferase [Acidimicrobiales bacterium]|nr:GNAT family N-acetyltransferase [Acidimicrobiales bacterium]
MEGVRPATEDDLARLAELARAAIAELTPMKGGGVWAAREARPEPVEESLKASLTDDHTRVVVGTIDDVPIGYAAVHVEVLNDGSRLGVIDDIFVEEGAREVGVGEAMMDDLVTWCTAQGCSGMDALALPGHRSAKNFFEESGFTARKLVMHHRLGERRSR